MSTENKLKRLGLWHLRDKPEELNKALEKIANNGPGSEPEEIGCFHDEIEFQAFKNAIILHFANINMNVPYESGYWNFTREEYKIVRELYFEVLDAALQTVIEKHHPKSTLEFESAFRGEQLDLWNRKIELIEAARMILESQTTRIFEMPQLLPRRVVPFPKKG